MAIVLDGTNGIDTPDLVSTGPVTGTTGTFSGAVQASGVATNLYPLVSGTAVTTTSGTSIDFTSIPSWVKRITVMFSGVGTNGTSSPQIQLGAGSVTTTGYLSANSVSFGTVTANANFTSGFGIGVSTSIWTAAAVIHGTVVLSLQNTSTNTWTACGNIASSAGAALFFTAGGIALSGTLDRVRITTVNGTDTFDAGSINILYE